MDAAYYVGRLLHEIISDLKHLLPAGFIFQQDDAPAQSGRLAQNSLNCPGLIEKDQLMPQILRIWTWWNNVWGATLEKYHNLQPKPKTTRELKVALELIWEDLPLEPINKAIKSFTKRLRKYVGTGGRHIEHKLRSNIKCVW